MLKKQIVFVAAAFAIVACGGSDFASSTARIGSAGGTLKAGSATLSVPADALTQSTQVTLREAEPRHAGRSHRFEVDPHGQSLAQPARLSVRVDDSNVKVKMHDGNDDLVPVEIEDRNHGGFKTTLGQLGEIEVELEHGRTCSPACAAGQECDDGVCKPHEENENAKVCDPVCASGQECDDGVCKAHREMEPGGPGGTATCNPACGTGLECDDGICKPHKP